MDHSRHAQVEMEEVANEAWLRALFPDNHSDYGDILAVDTNDTSADTATAAV